MPSPVSEPLGPLLIPNSFRTRITGSLMRDLYRFSVISVVILNRVMAPALADDSSDSDSSVAPIQRTKLFILPTPVKHS